MGTKPLAATSIEMRLPTLVRKCRALKPTLLPEVWPVLRAMVFAAYFTEHDHAASDWEAQAAHEIASDGPRRVHISDICVELAKPEAFFRESLQHLVRMNFIAAISRNETLFTFSGKGFDLAELAFKILEEGEASGVDWSRMRAVFSEVVDKDAPF